MDTANSFFGMEQFGFRKSVSKHLQALTTLQNNDSMSKSFAVTNALS